MSSDSIIDIIRSLTDGERVTVEYGFGPEESHPREVSATVADAGRGKHPLIDLEHDFIEGTLQLEYDQHYSDGTPYNLRFPRKPEVDGASVYSVTVTSR